MAKVTKTKRYNLVLPEELFYQVQEVADAEQTSMVDILRRFIKIGIMVAEVNSKPNSSLILREGTDETKIMFL